MTKKEADYSTIRIKNNIRKTLDSFKIENETYSVIIANIIEENKKLKETVEYLKEDKKDLYKLALKTSDSVALINNLHKIHYFIIMVIDDKSSTEEEKLQILKTYLKEMLEENPSEVSSIIKHIKSGLELVKETVPNVLIDFEKYVKDIY